MSLRVVFAGTPDFAVEPLKILLNSSHSVIAVYTQPDRRAGRGQALQFSAVKQLALQHHLPIFQPEHLKEHSIQEEFHQLNADILVVVAYGLILPSRILTMPKYGCINIHASLLPRWRGAAPIQQAIIAGDTMTGITIMQMDKGLDTGDMLLTSTCAIESNDTSRTLQNKLEKLGANALLKVLEQIENNTLSPQKQAEKAATYAPKITKADAKINWHENAITLDRKIRAFNPWPVAFSTLHEQTIRIWAATASNLSIDAKPGTILQVNQQCIEVATGNGILKLLELQWPGGKRLSVKEILKSKNSLLYPGCSFV